MFNSLFFSLLNLSRKVVGGIVFTEIRKQNPFSNNICLLLSSYLSSVKTSSNYRQINHISLTFVISLSQTSSQTSSTSKIYPS